MVEGQQEGVRAEGSGSGEVEGVGTREGAGRRVNCGPRGCLRAVPQEWVRPDKIPGSRRVGRDLQRQEGPVAVVPCDGQEPGVRCP